ncbi:MAG: ABC transporter permease [Candidatus Woesearchaeota archaeon]
MLDVYLNLVFLNFIHRKIRSWLTIIGIFIGITAIVALISLSQGFKIAMNEQFEMIGSDKIIITAKAGFFGMGSSLVLTDKDLEEIRNTPGVIEAAGFTFKIAPVVFDKEVKYLYVTGVPTDRSKVIFDEMQNIRVSYGRNLLEGDKKKALVGYYLCNKNLFKKNIKVGDKIIINGESFEVVGCLETFGNREDDTNIFIPLSDSKIVLNEPEKYFEIIVKVSDSSQIEKISENIEKRLRKLHNVKKGEEDFSLQTSQDIMRSMNTILLIVQIVFLGVAGISLLVGGVGIMNTMYTSVLERTRDIGVMKAVGAKNSDILKLFIIESGMLGLTGGIIGVVFGILIAKSVEFISTIYIGTNLLKANVSFTLIFGSILFAFLIGVISGVTPAIQASKLKPTEALRFTL